MKLLFVGQGYPGVERANSGSGIGTYLHEITLGLLDRGHECHVIVWSHSRVQRTTRRPHPECDKKNSHTQSIDGVTVHLLEHDYWPIIERIAPDSRDVYNLRKMVCRLQKEYDFDWIEIQNEEGIAIGVQKKFPGRTILRIHTTLAQMVEYRQVSQSWAVHRRLAREVRSFRLARRIITHSNLHAEQLRRDFPCIVEPAVVFHGIDFGDADSTIAGMYDWKDSKRKPGFLVVGTPDRRKGFDRLRLVLEAYTSSYGPCTGVIVSKCDDNMKRHFNLAPPFMEGVEIEWRSDVDEKSLLKEYKEASALLHLARYESFGLPLIEAAAMGTPVVSTKVGIAPQLLAGDLKRFLVDGDDPAACAVALTEAISDRENIGAKLRDQYERLFTRDRMVKDYLQILADLEE